MERPLVRENFFQASAMKTFILNAVGWLDAGKGGQVGIAGDLQVFFTLLSQEQALQANILRKT